MDLKYYLFVLFLVAAFPLFAQKTIPNNRQWEKLDLPVEQRVKTLIAAMTIEEKIGQLMNDAPAIERLNLPSYNWWNECLHGVARNGRATVFPQAIGLGATFDVDLIHRVASAISDEARAKFNIAQQMGNHSQYAGLTFWTPNVNLFRDPRWGRGQETYGEDPYLISRIGVAFVKGLQGDNPKYLKAAACAKHYAVHSGPEALRHEFDAIASPKDLWETYLPAFEACVKEAKVEAIMGAYNRTNGEACCASPYLLQDVLVDQWGFEGHIVSDCGAIRDIYRDHNLCNTPAEASAMAIKAGLDLNCGSTFKALDAALQQGLLKEKDLDKALKDLFTTRFKLGLMDPVDANPYNSIAPEVVNSTAHQKLSREAARKSIVLIKNDGNVLPLNKNINSLYVTGPQAANAEVLLGNYFGVSGNTTNILEGIVERVSLGTTINYKYGQLPFQNNINPIDWTTGEAKNSDACIAVMGISGLLEGEEGEALASDFKGDRKDIRLPQSQIDFLKKLSNGRTKPLILVITGGSPIALPEVYDLVDAILYVWYPGQEGGAAVADILFGDTSPSGKLPFTVPYSVDDLPPYEDYNMDGRTYRYMTKTPQFPFGFGLTYGDISFANLDLQKNKIKKGESINFSVEVSNNSDQATEEVVQLYLVSPEAGKGQPISSLKGFKRTMVPAKGKVTINMELSAEEMKLVNSSGQKVFVGGQYEIIIGNASPGQRSKKLGANFISAPFIIE